MTDSPTSTGVECEVHGRTTGMRTDGVARCHCGRFAAAVDDYCARHGIDYRALAGYDHCPRCRQERNRQAQMMERQTRHAPRMVDDPAPTSSYNAF